MTGAASWQDDNARYLSTALAWLRARLGWRAGQAEPAATAQPAPVSPPSSAPPPPREETRLPWRIVKRAEPSQPQMGVVLPLPAAPDIVVADGVAKAESDLAAASQMDPLPAMLQLAQLLGLSPFERDVLLLCVAMELDTGIASLCARVQGDPHASYPTFALALTLFDQPAWDALSAEHPLRYWRLIEISQFGTQPLTASPIRADERIVNYVKGLNYLDDRLSPLLTAMELSTTEAELPPSQQASVDQIVKHLKQVPAGESLPVVQLLGTASSSKQLVASHTARALNLWLYRLPTSLLPAQPAELENLARLCQREMLLRSMALYLDTMGPENEAQAASGLVGRLLARTEGVVLLDTRDPWPGLMNDSLSLDIAKPTPAEQASVWKAVLGDAAGETPALLAGQFNLSNSDIRRIAGQTLAEKDDRPLADRLWNACLETTRPQLDMLAQRLDPKVTWDDLVLSSSQSNLLRQIAAQVGQRNQVYQGWGFADKMSRGFGISALFAGDAGVGKTMAAEVIANQLRLNLYRIDLSAVVSKYIGETEKNLRRLFDAAEDGGAILFFDEADALFGKRSEVKDSHDRYANIEINYLLQRMEAYGGLAILATNMKSALDQAFMRRLRFVVDFQFPGIAERKTMWQKVFPPKVPVSELDLDALARLNLTGGNIQSIALNAAFLAAQAGSAVTQPLLLEAARTELRKLGRVVNELEFRRTVKTGAA